MQVETDGLDAATGCRTAPFVFKQDWFYDTPIITAQLCDGAMNIHPAKSLDNVSPGSGERMKASPTKNPLTP